ncbi:MAG: hypothetical protein A2020_10515 [Lentisphaerae bacterium GWF2_45_14]|nr:MAG: hypothetical protein A2020_10515 [Lentisphaerae bacterium GWF2_45_14]
MKTRLTKKGISLVLVLVFFYAISIQARSGLLFLFTGIILGCYLVNYMGAKRSLKALRISGMESIKGTENRKFSTSVTVANTSKYTAGMFTIKTGFGEFGRGGSIEPGGEHRMTPETVFSRRGIYQFNEITISSSYPFGLVKRSEKLETEGHFVVYPFVYECPPPTAAGFEPVTGGGHSGKHRSRTGGDFAGVRAYTPGDSFRAIHWKSSARGQGLMVKEFDEQLSGRTAIILDCTDFALPDGERVLDCATRAAASLAFSALDADSHVEFTDLRSMEITHNPAFMDGDSLLEKLAGIKEMENCLTKERLDEIVGKLSKKSSLAFVVAHANNDFIETLKQLSGEKRIISVYIPESEKMESPPVELKVYKYGRDSITQI